MLCGTYVTPREGVISYLGNAQMHKMTLSIVLPLFGLSFTLPIFTLEMNILASSYTSTTTQYSENLIILEIVLTIADVKTSTIVIYRIPME